MTDVLTPAGDAAVRGTSGLLAAADYGLSAFGRDPWWLIVGKVAVVFVFLMLMTLFNIWFERRLLARFQMRSGPNRVGPFGLLQSLADGLKLPLKEDLTPRGVDRPMFILAQIGRAHV